MRLNETWRDYIEIVGIIAILISLVFVQRELQLNGTIARAELSAETSAQLVQLDEMIINGEFSELWAKSIEFPNELTSVEKIRVNVFLENVLNQYRRECFYTDLEIFVECESVPRDTALKYFGSEYGRAYWSIVRNRMVGPRISLVVDEVLAAEPSTTIWMQINELVQENLQP